MTPFTEFADEHRRLEVELDRFSASMAAGCVNGEQFQRLKDLLIQHYRREETFVERLRTIEPGYADKLKAQHEEALEIAYRLEESLGSGETSDATYLARRLLAIAQHNIIEEERDVFPLAERWFGE